MKQPKADSEQLRDLGIQFHRHGVTQREDRLRLVREHAGRWVHSMSQLTWMEAASLQQRLRKVPVGVLPSHVARLTREEEQRNAERAGDTDPGVLIEKGVTRDRVVAIVCHGRRRGCEVITERDMEAVRQMGEQLELGVEES